jgi:hypothetical protein
MIGRLAILATLAGGILVAPLVALALGPAAAEAQYFGRNKVQYRNFDFRVLKTEHFDLYFYPEEEEAVHDAGRMVERAYARLSRILQHEFKERKPIILYASHSEFQQTNAYWGFIDESTGGMAESLKDRIIMPFTGSYASFDHVLTHELVHAFQYDIIFRRGLAGGDVSPLSARLPLWFMEGMAEYLAAGEVDAFTATWLRDAVLAGYLRTIADMNRRDDYLSYRFGQALWAYIGSKWGDEVVGILLQRAPRMGVERAFATTLGLTLDELSAEWTAAVRATYLPQVTDFDRPDGFARRLTAHDRLEDPWFFAPALSPDGAQLVLLTQQAGFSFDLWLADAHTGQLRRRLVNAAREADVESLRFMNSSAAFAPDGRHVAFVAQTGGRDALYVFDLERRRVVHRLHFELNGVANPTWSPDGASIAFSGNEGGLTDLYITDLAGNLRRLTRDRYAVLFPAWSHDGRTIAFTTDRGAGSDLATLSYGNLKVALYHLADDRIEILPYQDEGKNSNPVWAPDDRSLIWVSDRSGINNLYLYDLDEARLFRISDVLSGVVSVVDLSPALSWARSGQLAFVYFENAGYNIYTVDDPRLLPRTAVDGPAPAARTPLAGRPDRTPAVARRSETVPATAAADSVPAAAAAAAAVAADSAAAAAAVAAGTAGAAAPAAGVAAQPLGEEAFAASYYRAEDGSFRASVELPRAREATGPVTVLSLMEDAASALPDAASFEVADYSVRFTPDIVGRPTVGAQVGGHYGNGLYGGSYIFLSDILGDHNIVLAGSVNGSFQDAQFLAGYNYLGRRTNYGIAAQQVPQYRYLGTGQFRLDVDGRERDAAANVWLRDVVRSVQGVVAYPFSTYRRAEFGATAAHYTRDLIYQGYLLGTFEPLRHTVSPDEGGVTFLQPSAALVFDNAIAGWTGPVSGRRYRLQLSRTFGNFAFNEALVDARNYLNIRQTAVIASRFVALARTGEDASRFANYWGGPYFLRGYEGDSFSDEECQRSRDAAEMPLTRCPVRDQLIGSSAALMNLELRVPVIKELQIGFLGNFPPIDAIAFLDGGMAWDRTVCLRQDARVPDRCADNAERRVDIVWDRRAGQDPFLVREPLFSYGVGLRMNVFYAILRLDYAVPVNRVDQGGRLVFSIGPSF